MLRAHRCVSHLASAPAEAAAAVARDELRSSTPQAGSTLAAALEVALLAQDRMEVATEAAAAATRAAQSPTISSATMAATIRS